MPNDTCHVVIAGGGPAGLAAALALGRARKRVLLCDAPPPRNAAAVHVHNFVTRDGVTPAEFRRVARSQLAAYPNVVVRDTRVVEIRGARDDFDVTLSDGGVSARRVLLCTGMVDELPAIDGLAPLWGTSVFQCPYCHGWEIQDRRFAYLAGSSEALEFAVFLRGWTADVCALTDARFEVAQDARERLAAAGVRLEERRVARLTPREGALERIEFDRGASLERDALFVHPHQRQVDLVRSLGLALDAKGYVQLQDGRSETSIPGIYAAGDLTTPFQNAIGSAAAGTHAAAMLNRELTLALAAAGALA